MNGFFDSSCLIALIVSLQPLVQFKAGICNIAPQENGSFLVTPDPRKGLITMKREADRLLHFKWTDRTTNTVVKDLIVNSDVAFKRVRTGTPSDRVYILKWIAGDHRMMFWLQDKRTDNDTENCEKVNRLLTGNDQTNNEPGGDLMRMLRFGFFLFFFLLIVLLLMLLLLVLLLLLEEEIVLQFQ